MSSQYPEPAGPGLAIRTGNSRSSQASQVELPDRSVPPPHPKAYIPHAKTSIDRSSSSRGRGRGRGILNTGSSQPGSWTWKQGSNNEIDAAATAATATTATTATDAANAATKQDQSLTTPHKQATIRHRGKRGKRSKKNASTKTKTDIKTKTKTKASKTSSKSPSPQSKKDKVRKKLDKLQKKLDKILEKLDSGLHSAQSSGHEEQETSQKSSDGREKDGRDNNGGNVTILDDHSAQVPAFFHLLLLESLGAPANELKDEYVRERGRLAELYGLDLDESECWAAKEYEKNRSEGLVALKNREKIMAQEASG